MNATANTSTTSASVTSPKAAPGKVAPTKTTVSTTKPAAKKAAATKAKNPAPAKAAKPAKAAAPAAPAPKADKPRKLKLVRDSLSIPKDEYEVIALLKLRAGKLGHAAKKTEILRAGLKAIATLTDTAFLAALQAVPSIKTGRPAKHKSK